MLPASTESNTFHFRGSFLLDYRMAEASSAFFFIRRGEGLDPTNTGNRYCMDSLLIAPNGA
jgi:hypothetical protein